MTIVFYSSTDLRDMEPAKRLDPTPCIGNISFCLEAGCLKKSIVEDKTRSTYVIA